MITETDRAWMAGVLDLRILTAQSVRDNRETFDLMVQVYDVRVYEKLCRLTGLLARPPRERERKEWMQRPCTEHCMQKHVHHEDLRPQYQWRLRGVSAAILLWNLLPYMTHHNHDLTKIMTHILENARLQGSGSNAGRLAVQRLNDLGWEIPPNIMHKVLA